MKEHWAVLNAAERLGEDLEFTSDFGQWLHVFGNFDKNSFSGTVGLRELDWSEVVNVTQSRAWAKHWALDEC